MKKSSLIYVLVLILVLVISAGLYLFVFNNKESDAIRFAKEYDLVDKNNVFVYRSVNEIIEIMEKGTGVVYLGFPECPWCKAYVKYLNEVAKKEGIDKIYYFNILEDRKNNTPEYQKIVSLLSGSLQFNEEGKERIFVPNVSFHVKGKLIGNDYETSLDTKGLKDPNEYWTDEEVANLKDVLSKYMKEIYIALNACTDCNK